MKERPILMAGRMAQGSHEGWKTQTRRVMNRLGKMNRRPYPYICEFGVSDTRGYDWHFRDKGLRWNDVTHEDLLRGCPFGVAGDRLWVRETWGMRSKGWGFNAYEEPVWREGYTGDEGVRWRPSIHMPRSACRTILEITEVRVERLQDISEKDAKAEGVQEQVKRGIDICKALGAAIPGCPHRLAFKLLWDSLAKPGEKWDDNPWVWAISFRRIPHA